MDYFQGSKLVKNCISPHFQAMSGHHTRLLSIGTLCPGPLGQYLVTTILFWLKDNIYAQLSEKTE